MVGQSQLQQFKPLGVIALLCGGVLRPARAHAGASDVRWVTQCTSTSWAFFLYTLCSNLARCLWRLRQKPSAPSLMHVTKMRTSKRTVPRRKPGGSALSSVSDPLSVPDSAGFRILLSAGRLRLRSRRLTNKDMVQVLQPCGRTSGVQSTGTLDSYAFFDHRSRLCPHLTREHRSSAKSKLQDSCNQLAHLLHSPIATALHPYFTT